MGYFICDIETDSLDATCIHVICALDYDTDAVHTFTSSVSMGSELLLFPSFVEEHKDDKFVFHNGIGFDIPVINRLLKPDLFTLDNTEDTLILSQLNDPNPSDDGQGHSLGAWGHRLGFPKGDFHEFETLTPKMVEYCEQDVRVTGKLFKHLLTSLRKKKVSRRAIDLEYKVKQLVTTQEHTGFKLNVRKAMTLASILSDKSSTIQDTLLEKFVPLPILNRNVVVKYKKDGDVSATNLRHIDDLTTVAGDHSSLLYKEFNPTSRQQIAERLQRLGWEPSKFTEKGNIIVDESVLKDVTIPEAQMVSERMLLDKRVTQINSWIMAADMDDRVHGSVITLGAVSNRMTHHSPNMAQVPASYSPYGEECRDLWIPEEGNVILGCDASGLELRVLAHYLGDEKFTKEVVDGDIHTANQKAAGLETRDQAKTFIYAFIYGAGAGKIGEIVGGSSRDGQKLIDSFLKNVPALAALRARVEQEIEVRKGWIRGLDGRILKVRNAHSAVNLLCQSAGAIICKQWLVNIMSTTLSYNLKLVASIHDEYQFEVSPDQAEAVGQLTREAIFETEKILNVKCPLDSEYKIGLSWLYTH